MASPMRTARGTFAPGHKFATGRPGLTKEASQLLRVTRAELIPALVALIKMNRTELEDHMRNPNTAAFDLMAGSVIIKCIKDGCPMRLNIIYDRIFGKERELSDFASIESASRVAERVVNIIPREKLCELIEQSKDETRENTDSPANI